MNDHSEALFGPLGPTSIAATVSSTIQQNTQGTFRRDGTRQGRRNNSVLAHAVTWCQDVPVIR